MKITAGFFREIAFVGNPKENWWKENLELWEPVKRGIFCPFVNLAAPNSLKEENPKIPNYLTNPFLNPNSKMSNVPKIQLTFGKNRSPSFGSPNNKFCLIFPGEGNKTK